MRRPTTAPPQPVTADSLPATEPDRFPTVLEALAAIDAVDQAERVAPSTNAPPHIRVSIAGSRATTAVLHPVVRTHNCRLGTVTRTPTGLTVAVLPLAQEASP